MKEYSRKSRDGCESNADCRYVLIIYLNLLPPGEIVDFGR